MFRFLASAASLLALLALAGGEARAQCDAGFVLGNAQGVWKVNNAGGQGYGDPFIGKPQVTITAYADGSLAVDGMGPYPLGDQFSSEFNPNGGVWCSFIVSGYPGRIAYASNGWWIFEVGAYNDRNKVELVRR